MAESYGRNGLSTQKAYNEALLYLGNFPFIPNGEDNFPSALHSFRNAKGRFYGIVDTDGDVVMLEERSLKPLPSGRDVTQYALNFVSDAFSDLKETLSSGRPAHKVKDSPFANIIAKKGWVNYQEAYSEHISRLYEIFVTDFIQQKDRHKCINNIDQFINKFFNDFLSHMKGYPVTRSSFLLSQDPAISGLVIEISDDDHGHDLTKWRKWIDNPSFSYYRYAAAKHGFYVDLYAPWRLVANLSSPNMNKHMVKYGINNAKQLFSKLYKKSYKHDIESLKSNLFEMYNDFLIMSPQYSKPRTSSQYAQVGARTAFSVKTENTFRRRNWIELNEYNIKYDNSYWIKLYILRRLREISYTASDQELKGVLFRAEELQKYVDFSKALEYINDIAKQKDHINFGDLTP